MTQNYGHIWHFCDGKKSKFSFWIGSGMTCNSMEIVTDVEWDNGKEDTKNADNLGKKYFFIHAKMGKESFEFDILHSDSV